MSSDEIITLNPGDDELVADFAAFREHANRLSEHFEDDDMFIRMLMHGGYRELLELYDDMRDDDGDDGSEIRGFQ